MMSSYLQRALSTVGVIDSVGLNVEYLTHVNDGWQWKRPRIFWPFWKSFYFYLDLPEGFAEDPELKSMSFFVLVHAESVSATSKIGISSDWHCGPCQCVGLFLKIFLEREVPPMEPVELSYRLLFSWNWIISVKTVADSETLYSDFKIKILVSCDANTVVNVAPLALRLEDQQNILLRLNPFGWPDVIVEFSTQDKWWESELLSSSSFTRGLLHLSGELLLVVWYRTSG